MYHDGMTYSLDLRLKALKYIENGGSQKVNNLSFFVYLLWSTHISFMDHGYIYPPRSLNLNEDYFNGTLEERTAFFISYVKIFGYFQKAP
jgi:hypothetical protein